MLETLDEGETLIRSFSAPNLAISLATSSRAVRDSEGLKIVSLSSADSSSVNQRFTINQTIKAGQSCLYASESFIKKTVQSDDLSSCSNYRIEAYVPPFDSL